MRRRCFGGALAGALQLLQPARAGAENHADYRFEAYLEEAGRIGIQTHSILFEQALLPELTLEGEYVRDAVSGASPTGAPPLPGSSQVPLKHMDDLRNAGFLEAQLHLGPQTLTPQVSYSLEDDYESIGISLTDSIDFNQKNTVLSFGYAHDFDSVFPNFWGGIHRAKNSDDWFVGLTQLLSPVAYVSANFTYGTSSGYLNDPYKGVHFDGYPDPVGDSTFPEKRPTYKAKEVGYFSAAYFIEPLKAGAEAGYRLYHDSFGITSHTLSLGWHQHLGKHVLLNPLFRYDWQNAADFYAPRFPGDPTDPESPVPIPNHYSADYRLSALHTFTLGISATILLKEWIYLDLGYQRYEMHGNDSVTSASAYPKANVFSAGFRILW